MKYSDLFQKYSPELLHKEPSFWKEFKGEFISFDKDKEKLSTRFPVDDRYFNPLNILLGGIMDCYMDATMGPLTVLLGEREVTKSFHAKYIRSINSLDSFVKVIAWRESKGKDESIYKAELYNDRENIAAVSEAIFVSSK